MKLVLLKKLHVGNESKICQCTYKPDNYKIDNISFITNPLT